VKDDCTHNKGGAHLPDANLEAGLSSYFLATERTPMAWGRPALSFISFGFTISLIYLLPKAEGERAPLLSARAIAIIMISIGPISLSLADLQHRHSLKALSKQCPVARFSGRIHCTPDCAVGLIGIMSAIFRQ